MKSRLEKSSAIKHAVFQQNITVYCRKLKDCISKLKSEN